MATVDKRSSYELLRRAIHQKNLQQQLLEFEQSQSENQTSGPGGGGAQGGLLGRLQVLGGGLNQRSLAGVTEAPPSRLLDANVRRLSRLPIPGRKPDTIQSSRNEIETSQDHPPVGSEQSGFSPEASLAGAGSFDAFGERTAAPWFASATTAPLSWRGRGSSVPIQPSTPRPPISFPVPDWWDTAAKILQILPRGIYGNGSDGRDAYGRCIRAAEGSIDDWNDFCTFLGRGTNHVAGGGSQNQACWGKTHESATNKRNWCENQFRGH
jgi:hypothetical protein